MSMGGENLSNDQSGGRGNRLRIWENCVVRALVALAIASAVAIPVGMSIEPRVPATDLNADMKDFFNDVVALCVVVLFAKFVSHNSRGKNRDIAWEALHVLCVLSAGLGVFAALRGAEGGHPGLLYNVAWVGAATSTAILIADVVLAPYLRR